MLNDKKEGKIMKNFNFRNLKAEELLELEDLVKRFKEYCKNVLGYSENEAELAAVDMKTPYDTPYVFEEYEMMLTFENVEYEVRFCYTNFDACGLFYLENVEPFEFYTLYDKSTIKNGTVGEYKNARKKFVV